MDFAALIPVAAIAIGVPGFVGFVALMANHTRKLKELALRERELEAGGGPAFGAALDALTDELHHTRTQVAELQERVDFAERLLAAGKAPGADGGA